MLHVYAQSFYHGEAIITGSPEALRRLGEAILKASKSAHGKETTVNMMTNDGEGYQVVIRPDSQQAFDKAPLPYAQLGLPWDFEPSNGGK